MARKIAIANQKGGVGKTTTAFNVGVALALKRKKTLLVDLDNQASLTISVGLEPLEMDKNISHIMDDKGIKTKNCIYNIRPGLDIITSDISLAAIETTIILKPSPEKILSKALKQIDKDYDYIVIDCPPQLGMLTINALVAADSVIIPVKTDYLSYRGLNLMLDSIAEIKQINNRSLEVIGIVATFYDSRKKDDRVILDALKDKYGVLCVAKDLTAARKGIYDGLSVVEYDPKSDLSKAYKQLANKIIKIAG